MVMLRLALVTALATGCLLGSGGTAFAAEGETACRLESFTLSKLKRVSCRKARRVFRKYRDERPLPRGWSCREAPPDGRLPHGRCRKPHSDPTRRKSFRYGYGPILVP